MYIVSLLIASLQRPMCFGHVLSTLMLFLEVRIIIYVVVPKDAKDEGLPPFNKNSYKKPATTFIPAKRNLF